MPLTQASNPERSARNLGELVQAESDDGAEVLVSASHEAIEDYGWDTIWDAASEKYDRFGGSSVHVTTDDCLS